MGLWGGSVWAEGGVQVSSFFFLLVVVMPSASELRSGHPVVSQGQGDREQQLPRRSKWANSLCHHPTRKTQPFARTLWARAQISQAFCGGGGGAGAFEC